MVRPFKIYYTILRIRPFSDPEKQKIKGLGGSWNTESLQRYPPGNVRSLAIWVQVSYIAKENLSTRTERRAGWSRSQDSSGILRFHMLEASDSLSEHASAATWLVVMATRSSASFQKPELMVRIKLPFPRGQIKEVTALPSIYKHPHAATS